MTIEIPERVVTRINSRITHAPNGCWVWTQGKVEGYGRITWSVDKKPVWKLVHRLMYELANGPIPDGMDVDHLCHNPSECQPEIASDCPHRACCNPEHLAAVTRRENLLRGGTVSAARRSVTHCPQGHELTAENTLLSKLGQRQCKACTYERNRAYYWKNKERRSAYNREWRLRNIASQPGNSE